MVRKKILKILLIAGIAIVVAAPILGYTLDKVDLLIYILSCIFYGGIFSFFLIFTASENKDAILSNVCRGIPDGSSSL